MARVDRIVKVNITLQSRGVEGYSFSEMALMGIFTHPDRVSIVTDADDVLLAPYSLSVNSDMYKALQVAFSQKPRPAKVYLLRRDSAEAVNTALAACAGVNNEWYGFCEVSHAPADLPAAFAWAQANQKLFGAVIDDVDVTATTGDEPATALKASNWDQGYWFYNANSDEFPEVAIMAKQFQTLPGGDDWADQTLYGVTAPPMVEGAYVNITNKNGNTYETFRNIAITQNGVTPSGEWIDVIRFYNWLCEEIRVRVFNLKVNRRIPCTDEGIAMIRQVIHQALDLGVRRGGIAPPEQSADDPNVIIPSFTISVPLASSVSKEDKQARILRDVKFSARLAGSIHSTVIDGVLTYDQIG